MKDHKMKSIKTFAQLEDFGRIRLSKNFFMREFLHSEISQHERVPNIPDDPELAIKAGKALCENVLEPIQYVLGRISIRSGFRSCEINATSPGAKTRISKSRLKPMLKIHIQVTEKL